MGRKNPQHLANLHATKDSVKPPADWLKCLYFLKMSWKHKIKMAKTEILATETCLCENSVNA